MEIRIPGYLVSKELYLSVSGTKVLLSRSSSSMKKPSWSEWSNSRFSPGPLELDPDLSNPKALARLVFYSLSDTEKRVKSMLEWELDVFWKNVNAKLTAEMIHQL